MLSVYTWIPLKTPLCNLKLELIQIQIIEPKYRLNIDKRGNKFEEDSTRVLYYILYSKNVFFAPFDPYFHYLSLLFRGARV